MLFASLISKGNVKVAGYSAATQASGVLNVFYNKTWGFVCSTWFKPKDAKVFCREIGQENGHNYTDGILYTAAVGVKGPYFIYHANCTGNETSHHSCGSPIQTQCTQAAAVLCFQSQGKSFSLDGDPFHDRANLG